MVVSMSQDSIFTKIIKGELPCHRVYEDDRVIAFLDIHPVQPGHTLVIPKKQVDHLWDLSQQDYDAVMGVVRRVAQKIRSEIKQARRVGMQVEGLDVPHAHVSVFPFNTSQEFRSIPEATDSIDHAALEAMALRLKLEEES